MKKIAFLSVLCCILLFGCRKDPIAELSDGSVSATNPPDTIVAANFVTGVTNKYFPLIPGRTFRYIRTVANGTDTIRQDVTVSVTNESKIIQGVTCMVVHEVTTQDSAAVEDILTYYAQDNSGTVWKFGEARKTVTGGIADTTGSWLAGVDSARAGIKMFADPGAHLGELYYQEYALGIAEDQGQVHDTTRTATVPFGTFINCVRIHDSTALDSSATRHSWYAAGLGMVLKQGGPERQELIAVTDSATADSSTIPTSSFKVGRINGELKAGKSRFVSEKFIIPSSTLRKNVQVASLRFPASILSSAPLTP